MITQSNHRSDQLDLRPVVHELGPEHALANLVQLDMASRCRLARLAVMDDTVSVTVETFVPMSGVIENVTYTGSHDDMEPLLCVLRFYVFLCDDPTRQADEDANRVLTGLTRDQGLPMFKRRPAPWAQQAVIMCLGDLATDPQRDRLYGMSLRSLLAVFSMVRGGDRLADVLAAA